MADRTGAHAEARRIVSQWFATEANAALTEDAMCALEERIAAALSRPSPGDAEREDLSPRTLLIKLVDGDLTPGQKIDAILARDRAIAIMRTPQPAGPAPGWRKACEAMIAWHQARRSLLIGRHHHSMVAEHDLSIDAIQALAASARASRPEGRCVMAIDRSVGSTFRNELGRQIDIEVTRSDDEVCIRIEGPSSTSNNTLTDKEASELTLLLVRVMQPKDSSNA